MARYPNVRKIDDDDTRYFWAMHRKEVDEAVTPEEFRLWFSDLKAQFDKGWIVEAPTSRGIMPVGSVFGVSTGHYFEASHVIWFPWATARNKLEATVSFFNKLRNEMLILFHCPKEERRFFEKVSDHGVLRKVGHIHDLYDGEPAVQFQTRAK